MEQEFLHHIAIHKALIYKVCHIYEGNEDARRDLFQDIVVQLWRAFPKYNKALKWTTWAYRISLNVAITQRRKTKIPIISLSGGVQQDFEKSWQDTPYDASTDDRLAALYAAIAQLNTAEKALIILYLDGIGYAEIAEIVGITENNVGVKLNRIKTKLKLLLSNG